MAGANETLAHTGEDGYDVEQQHCNDELSLFGAVQRRALWTCWWRANDGSADRLVGFGDSLQHQASTRSCGRGAFRESEASSADRRISADIDERDYLVRLFHFAPSADELAGGLLDLERGEFIIHCNDGTRGATTDAVHVVEFDLCEFSVTWIVAAPLRDTQEASVALAQAFYTTRPSREKKHAGRSCAMQIGAPTSGRSSPYRRKLDRLCSNTASLECAHTHLCDRVLLGAC